MESKDTTEREGKGQKTEKEGREEDVRVKGRQRNKCIQILYVGVLDAMGKVWETTEGK